jgi:hypothetical protein
MQEGRDNRKTRRNPREFSRRRDGGLTKPTPEASAGMLYRLSVAFPGWAGAILALYALFMSKGIVSRIRLR